MKQCQTCGKTVSRTATFCPYCGGRGERGPREVAPEPAPQPDCIEAEPSPEEQTVAFQMTPEMLDELERSASEAPERADPKTLLGHPTVGQPRPGAPKTILGHPAVRPPGPPGEPATSAREPETSGEPAPGPTRREPRTVTGAPAVPLRHLAGQGAGAPPDPEPEPSEQRGPRPTLLGAPAVNLRNLTRSGTSPGEPSESEARAGRTEAMLPSVSDEAATEAFLPVVTDEDIREVQARQDPPAERPPARTLLGAPVVSAADLARTAAPAEPPAETAHPSPPPEAASPGTPHPAPTNPAAAGPALEQPRPPSTLLPPLEDLRALVPQPARGLFGSIAYARRAGPARRRLSGVLRALDAPGADQVYGAEVARLAATIDDRTIRRGRLLLVILVTTPIVLALLAWLVFGVLLSDDAVGSKAESAPDAARNTGPSSATLARALPPGYHAYVGLSLEGTRSAEVLAGLTPLIERLPTLDRLRAADIPAQEVDVLLFALGPDGLLEVAGTAHAAAAARARLGDSAHVHDDGTVVIGPTEEQVAAVAERLAAESSEGFATGDLADLAEYVDQNGTLWLMADRTGLEPLRRQGRNGEVPREARRLIRRATGLALTVHAANALHVSAAVRFDDAEAAAAALEVVEALIAEHRQALEATPDGTEQAAAAARAILGTAQVSTDGRYLRVVLTVTAEQAAPLRELST